MVDFGKFVNQYPRLYHLSSDAALAGIGNQGLLCTSEIFRGCGIISDRQKLAIYEDRRKGDVTLPSQGQDLVVVRDQKPLCWSGLSLALEGKMAALEWIDLLNDRVFFWIRLQDAMNLAHAASYRHTKSTLIEFDSKSLFEEYGDKIALTTFNVGYTMRKPKMRCPESFRSLDSFLGRYSSVRELTVLGSVKNATHHMHRATLLGPGKTSTLLFAAT